MQGVATLPELVSEIGAAFEEGGQIRESASEDLKRTRAKVRTVEGRLRGVLKVRWLVSRVGVTHALYMHYCMSRRPMSCSQGDVFVIGPPGLGLVRYVAQLRGLGLSWSVGR